MIVVVAGTRPEHLKVCEVIRELRAIGRPVKYLWTGQHHSAMLADEVFVATGGPWPDAFLPWRAAVPRRRRAPTAGPDKPPLDVWSSAASSAHYVEQHLDGASLVLVQGDTASALAGALAAGRAGVPLAHLEAGLRSHDWTMPEEHVRCEIDAHADLLLCPSALAAATCRIERASTAATRGAQGLPKIVHVGQTGIDSLVRAAAVTHDLPAFRASVEALFGTAGGTWALVTLHRAALTGDPKLLLNTAVGIAEACAAVGYRPVWATHPRVTGNPGHAKALAAFWAAGGTVIDPLGYRTLAALLLARDGRDDVSGFADRAIVVTDSGGLAEDATYAHVPVVIVRPTTERQELVAAYPHRVRIAAPGDTSGLAAEIVAAAEATRGRVIRPRPVYGYPYDPRSPGGGLPHIGTEYGPTASRGAALAIKNYLAVDYGASP